MLKKKLLQLFIFPFFACIHFFVSWFLDFVGVSSLLVFWVDSFSHFSIFSFLMFLVCLFFNAPFFDKTHTGTCSIVH